MKSPCGVWTLTRGHFLLRVLMVSPSVIIASKLRTRLLFGGCTTGPLEAFVSRSHVSYHWKKKSYYRYIQIRVFLKTCILNLFLIHKSVVVQCEVVLCRTAFIKCSNVVGKRIQFSCVAYFANPLLDVIHEPLHWFPEHCLFSGFSFFNAENPKFVTTHYSTF